MQAIERIIRIVAPLTTRRESLKKGNTCLLMELSIKYATGVEGSLPAMYVGGFYLLPSRSEGWQGRPIHLIFYAMPKMQSTSESSY